ncbi:MAG: hypothetical protein LC775_11595 [Acidobacteria bacterium]|nr:hypothetical protein [Acidobacteriota bacterium]
MSEESLALMVDKPGDMPIRYAGYLRMRPSGLVIFQGPRAGMFGHWMR